MKEMVNVKNHFTLSSANVTSAISPFVHKQQTQYTISGKIYLLVHFIHSETWCIVVVTYKQLEYKSKEHASL
jgi:hypothetical protein